MLLPALDAIAVRGPAGGRPRKGPGLLLADKGYAHDSARTALRRRRIRHAIPERSDQAARRAGKGSRGGQPPEFDRDAYKPRNVVERCIGRLKQPGPRPHRDRASGTCHPNTAAERSEAHPQ